MKEVLISLFTIATTGLGFVSYKFPAQAKIIIKYIIIVPTLMLTVNYFINVGSDVHFSTIQQVISQPTELPFKSIDSSTNQKIETNDTGWANAVNGIKNKFSSLERDLLHYGIEMSIRERIAAKINVELANVNDRYQDIRNGLFLCIFVLLILNLIAEVFDKSGEPEKNDIKD